MAETDKSELMAKVLKQVEFYFSDSNFPRDRFLKDLANKNEGWVPISAISTFKRVRDLTTDNELLVDSLLLSKDLLHVSEDRKMVKRATPIPEDIDATKRTIYAKGFPLDTTLEALEAFFASTSTPAQILSVRMRRTIETRAFKGSVFVEFATEEAAAEWLKETERSFGDNKLITMSKTEFSEQKKNEYEERKAKRATKSDNGNASAPAAAAAAITVSLAQEDTVVKIENINAGETISRESLKDLFGEYGTVQFIDYSRGNASGYVRFAAPGSAGRAATALTEQGVEFNGVKPTFTALTGEENEKYYVHVAEEQTKRRKGHSGNKSNPAKRRMMGKGGRDSKRQKSD